MCILISKLTQYIILGGFNMELIINRLSRKELLNSKRVGSGMYSTVYQTQEGIVAKVIDDLYYERWLEEKEKYDELSTLENLSGCGVTPYYFGYDYDTHAIYMEEIDGPNIEGGLGYYNRRELNLFWDRLEQACLNVINFGYMPHDLHGNNIKYYQGNVIFIDLGRYQKIDSLRFIHNYGNAGCHDMYLSEIRIGKESVGNSNTKGDLLISSWHYSSMMKRVNDAIHNKLLEVLNYGKQTV